MSCLYFSTQVTPSERKLFFAAAHAHFQNGCPLVAMEVMRKLPTRPLLTEETGSEVKEDIQNKGQMTNGGWIASPTSTFNPAIGDLSQTSNRSADPFNSLTLSSNPFSSTSGSNSFSSPAAPTDKSADLFSSSTVTNPFASQPASNPFATSSSIDWGTPVSKMVFDRPDTTDIDMKDLGFQDSSESEDEEEGSRLNFNAGEEASEVTQAVEKDVGEEDKSNIDIMAQQYKFIACLKVRNSSYYC